MHKKSLRPPKPHNPFGEYNPTAGSQVGAMEIPYSSLDAYIAQKVANYFSGSNDGPMLNIMKPQGGVQIGAREYAPNMDLRNPNDININKGITKLEEAALMMDVVGKSFEKIINSEKLEELMYQTQSKEENKKPKAKPTETKPVKIKKISPKDKVLPDPSNKGKLISVSKTYNKKPTLNSYIPRYERD